MTDSAWRLPYESCRYSQHGEDGIIQLMTDAICDPNRFVFEIGWGSGVENMSRNLFEQGWSGIGIDGARKPHPALVLPDQFCYRSMYVTPHTLPIAFEGVPQDLDFFSLDIDSFDFDVAYWALNNGYRPKTVCVEINQTFGPDIEASFPWQAPQNRPKRIYDKQHLYGSSLAKYQAFWCSHEYRFFTVDSSSVNAFFYDPKQVDPIPDVPILDNSELGCQSDCASSVIDEHPYWQHHRSLIYRRSIEHAPIDACDASIDPMPGPQNSNGTEPTGAATDPDQT
jgi:hypothetical protein